MAVYVIRLYRGASYFPDRDCHCRSRGRAERRMEQARSEGFQPRMLVLPGSQPLARLSSVGAPVRRGTGARDRGAQGGAPPAA